MSIVSPNGQARLVSKLESHGVRHAKSAAAEIGFTATHRIVGADLVGLPGCGLLIGAARRKANRSDVVRLFACGKVAVYRLA